MDSTFFGSFLDITSKGLLMTSDFSQKCWFNNAQSSLYCMNENGYGFSINKKNSRYFRTKIYNEVGSTTDIIIAHGTCEKF